MNAMHKLSYLSLLYVASASMAVAATNVEEVVPIGEAVERHLSLDEPFKQWVQDPERIESEMGDTLDTRETVADAVFEPDSVEMRNQWRGRIGLLLDELQKGPAVLRLSYVADVEGEALVERRLDALKNQIMTAWQDLNCCYELIIEPEIFWRLGAPPDKPKGESR